MPTGLVGTDQFEGTTTVLHRDRDSKPIPWEQEVESEHRAGVDLAWIVVVCVLAVAGAIWFSVPDRILSKIDRSGQLDLNGLLALIVVIPLGATIFASRRYRDAVGAQRELAHLSDHDALTRLPNRRNLRATLPKAMAEAGIVNSRTGVMFVDLDGFKAVNDTYGHEVGDHLMVEVAQRLRSLCGEEHWVARHGGDEFVILDRVPSSRESCSSFARLLVDRLSQPFELGEDRISISASVGIAFGGPLDDPERIVKDADLAMYDAKRGDQRVAVFTDTMRVSLTPATVGARLERAITGGEFRLVYQPMVLLGSGTVVGVEALLRWDDPERGVVNPVDFMPALEATGLMVPVGRWVMNEVCSKARHWGDMMPAGVPALRVSMNVSPRELAQSDFVDELRSALERSGTDPQSVYLEANETSLTSDSLKAWTALTGARELGVGLAIDNFGRGFISLGHLRNFEFNLLKLDGPFAALVAGGGPDAVLVRNVIELAGKLGIAVLAEGLSDEALLRTLESAGCQLGQGFVICGPLSAASVDELIVGGLAGIALFEQRRAVDPDQRAESVPEMELESATVVLPRLRRTMVDEASVPG